MTIKIYLDTRNTSGDSPAPLKICISKQSRPAYISLDTYVKPSQWDSKKQKVKDLPNHNVINNFLQNKLLEVQNMIFGMSSRGEITKMTSQQIKESIMRRLCPDVESGNMFMSYFKKVAQSKRAQRTKEIYMSTYDKILRFDQHSPSLSFEQVTKGWLHKFGDFMINEGLMKNTRNIHFRNIRAVFNDAIDNEITTNYPLRHLDMSPSVTRKRSLSATEFRRLLNSNVTKWQERYLDYFKLTFLLIGINPKDLLLADRHSLQDGRLNYERSKTGKPYSIKIVPEAMALIEKYRGKDLLVNFSERMKSYKTFVGKCDKGLKTIGVLEYYPNPRKETHNRAKHVLTRIAPLFPDLSIYWARHTWATIAYQLGISDETIAAALGHSHGNRTTAIYIDKSTAKVDEANRKVIDYILYGEECHVT